MSTRYAWMLVPLCLFSMAGVAGAQEERRAPADRQELSISGRVLVTNGLPPEDMAVYLGTDTEFGFESGSNHRGRMAPSTSGGCPGV